MRYDQQSKASWTALPSAPPRYPAAAHQAWLPPKNIDLLGEYALLLFHRFCICYVFVELVYRDMIILVGIYRQTRNGESALQKWSTAASSLIRACLAVHF